MKNTTNACGCCEGTQSITPQPLANRPGLSALSYRVGTHSTFLETMRARLSSLALKSPTTELDERGRPKIQRTYPLRNLTTRAPDDPSIALLDAWATVADVLTFYQERIANEGYLRTATERRSVLELARLVGYALRPGVAASVWLALELDKDYEVTIQPNELKAQSVPGQGEMPQTFENSEPLEARHAWNKLQPRLTQPQTIDTIISNEGQKRLYVKGISTNLKPNDVVLITENDEPEPGVFHVAEAKPDPANDRTLVTFQEQAPRADLIRIAELAQRYATQEVANYSISPETQTAGRVLSLLKELKTRVLARYRSAESAGETVGGLLDRLAVERDAAVEGGYERLRPWLMAMTRDLEDAAQEVFAAAAREKACALPVDPLKNAMAGLTKRASIPPRNALSLERDIATQFGLEPPKGLVILNSRTLRTPPPSTADLGLQIEAAFDRNLYQSLPIALANVKATGGYDIRAYVFRAVARPFGHNAPLRAVASTKTEGETEHITRTSFEEWDINDPLGTGSSRAEPHHEKDQLYLESEYKIQAQGWIYLTGQSGHHRELFLNLTKGDATASQQSLAAYGISGKTTLLQLKTHQWLDNGAIPTNQPVNNFAPVRNTIVYCESEDLALSDEPIENPIRGGDQEIELNSLYSGLQSGRWLIVSGERDDITDHSGNKVRGIQGAELVMLAEVAHKVKEVDSVGLPGDQTHTFIKLAKKLEYSYRRDTVSLYGNVVKATHGETRKETLGSGDASQAFQAFTLKQPPLTFVASPTPAGAESTLKVYVNDVQWDEADNPAELAPTDREFITKTDDEGKTTVIFGNGQRGARLPTGIENVRAQYRNGIGRAGNVRAEQISQLMSKPLGVKGVINPLRASGGADKESRDTARKNAPLAITALDRLVSVADYADFARTFAGIGKAVAAAITDGKREWVHVTIAGADDIPIDETSDLYRNLLQALHDNGDPYQAVALQTRELLLLVISAKLRILPKYQWEPVVTAVRTRLLDTFSFERRELGQDVLLSEVIATIQSVPGVAYVDVDAFGGVPEKKTDTNDAGRPIRRLLTPKEISDEAATFVRQSLPAELPQSRLRVNLADFDEDAMRPAQLAYLLPIPADMLVLNQIQ